MAIDYDLIPVKALNFFYQAGLSCLLSYKTIFQKQLGISAEQNGIISAFERFVSLIAPPLLGAVVDKFSSYKVTMIACCVIATATALPMYFVPPVENNEIVLSCCYNQSLICEHTSYIDVSNATCTVEDTNCDKENLKCTFEGRAVAYCPSYNQNTVYISHHNGTFYCGDLAIAVNCSWKETSEVYGLTFSLITLLSVAFMIVTIPLGSLIDATAIHVLGEERVNDFGKLRLWGAVGFGVTALLTGFLIDVLTKLSCQSKEKDYLFAFVGVGVFNTITALICLKLDVPQHKLKSLLSGLNILLRNFRIVWFLSIILLSGFIMGAKFSFLFWYVEQLPGSTPTLLGFAMLISCFSEIPLFLVSGWIADKIGYNAMLSIGLISASTQCFLYTLMPTAWPVLLVEVLQSVTFALPMSAMTSYAAVLAPPGMVATLIGLTQGMYWGLGHMTGSLVAGILYEKYGAKTMFKVNAAVGLTVAVIYLSVVKILDSCQKKEISQQMESHRIEDPLSIEPLAKE